MTNEINEAVSAKNDIQNMLKLNRELIYAVEAAKKMPHDIREKVIDFDIIYHAVWNLEEQLLNAKYSLLNHIDELRKEELSCVEI
jgi:hypothetical protein